MSQPANYCRQCGALLQKDDFFCGECGQSVTPVSEEGSEAASAASPAKVKRRCLRYAVAAMVLFLILGAGYMFRKKIQSVSATLNSAPQSDQNQPETTVQPPSDQHQAGQKRDINYYETAAADAFRKRQCRGLKNILDEGLDFYPDSSKLWGELAGYNIVCQPELSEVDRGQRALNAAMRAYQLDATDQNAVNVGWIYYSILNDYANAVFYYEKGLKHADRDPSLYYYLGQCYDALQNPHKALEYYGLFIRVAPNNQYAPNARMRMSALGG